MSYKIGDRVMTKGGAGTIIADGWLFDWVVLMQDGTKEVFDEESFIVDGEVKAGDEVYAINGGARYFIGGVCGDIVFLLSEDGRLVRTLSTREFMEEYLIGVVSINGKKYKEVK